MPLEEPPAGSSTPVANPAPATPGSAAPDQEQPIKVGDSGLVTMHINDLDIRQALELLSRQATLNILVSPGVQGQVTINLDKVTVEQALDSLMKLGNLTSRKEGKLIYVMTPPELIQQQGERGQITTRVYRLNYIRSADIDEMLRPFLSEAGKLTVTPDSQQGISGGTNLFGGFGAFGSAGGSGGGSGGGAGGGGGGGGTGGGGGGGGGGAGGGGGTTGGNSLAGSDVIIVQDFESNLRTIDEIIAKLDVQPLQVMVEAVIMSVELARGTNLGINFAVLNGNNGQGLAMLGNGLELNDNAGFTPKNVINRTTGQILGGVANGFLSNYNSFKYGFIDNRVTGFIRALETIGQVNVLASPRVLVLNKQRAEIQLGQRLGYFTVTQNLTSTVQQVQFLNTGTLLRFRPFVSNDGMIRMEVHPEKSTGNVSNNVPTSNTSEVTTNVMVPDGATIVIGGLIENTDNSAQQGTLGLSKLPVVGPLFRNKTQDSLKRELIVLLTPRIWNPQGLMGSGAPLPNPNCSQPFIGLASPNDDAPRVAVGSGGGSRPSSSAAPASSSSESPGARADSRRVDPATTPTSVPVPAQAPQSPTPTGIKAAASGDHSESRIIRDPALMRTSATIIENEPGEPADASIHHVVRRGENFFKIARVYYGSGRYYKALWAANRDQVSAPELLVVGQRIVVPPVENLDESLVLPPTSRTPAPSSAPAVAPRSESATPSFANEPRRGTWKAVGKPTMRGEVRQAPRSDDR